MLRIFSKLSQSKSTWRFCTSFQTKPSKIEERAPRYTRTVRPQTDNFDVFTKFLGGKQQEHNEENSNSLKKVFNIFRDRNMSIEDFKTQIKNSLLDGFKLGDYSRLSKQDFQWWVQQGTTQLQEQLQILFNQNFFAQNTDFVNSTLIQNILERARKRQDRVLGLEFLKYHQQFIENKENRSQLFQGEDQFFEFFNDLVHTSPYQFDELSVYYHCFHLNQSRIITKQSVNKVVSAMTRIRWGSPQINSERLDYQGNHISDLLNMKFKQSLNENLQLFLADLFLGSPNYRNGLLCVSLVLLVLSRLSQHSNELNDLLEALRKNAGEERFTFYMENHLPLVLKSYNQTLYHSIYSQAMKSYKISYEQRSRIEWLSISPLDRYFLQNDEVYFNHENAAKSEPIKYSINPLFDLNQSPQLKINQKLQESITAINTKTLIAQLLEETNIKSENDIDPINSVQRFINKDYIQKTKYASYPKQQRDSRETKLGNIQKSEFSSQPGQDDQQKPNSIGAGFIQYLKRAKEIDTATSAPQTPPPETYRETPFISPKLFGGTTTKQKNSEPKKVEEGSIRFEKIEMKSNQQTIQKQEQPQQQFQETWLQNAEKLTQATLDIQPLFQNEPSKEELIEKIEGYFIKVDNSENNNLYETLALINKLNNEAFGQQILFKIFCSPEIAKQNPQPNTSNNDLKISFETKFGTIEKDYRHYLGPVTVFPYEVPGTMYDILLSQTSTADIFHRRQFKKIIAHIAAYAKEMNQSTLDLILGIAVEKKIPLSLLEAINLFIKKNVLLTQTQIFQILDTLQRFKQIDQECEPILVNAFDRYEWVIEYSVFQKYVANLIFTEQTTRHLHLYELLKDLILLTKRKIEQPGLTRKDIITNYALKYCNTLLQEEQIESARKVLANVRGLKSVQSEEFNRAWLHSHANLPDEAVKIFQEHTEKNPELIDEKYIIKICQVVQKSPSRLLEFFGTVTSEWVFSRKVKLTPEFINVLSITFLATKEYTSFTTLIKVIFDEQLPMELHTKNVWVKLMKRCPDDAQKGQIKGAIDQIFGAKEKLAQIKSKGKVESAKIELSGEQKITVEEKISEIDDQKFMNYKEVPAKKDKTKLRFNKFNFLITSQDEQPTSVIAKK